MSHEICIWKNNENFRKEVASSVYGQLVEGDTKPDQIDITENIQKLVHSISAIYPPLDDDPTSVWASSFICSEWHCTVSISYDHPSYNHAFMEVYSLCAEYGLTLFDSSTGKVFPE